jgi:tRNA1(Val) A37 N6-methylase TrmN6
MIAGLLTQNITKNGLSGRITPILGDALAPDADWHGRHDIALANPPYNDAASSLSANTQRKSAMVADDLGAWISALARALAPKGRMVMISRADRLDEMLTALAPDFGDCSILPIHTLPDAPASRVLLSARKGISGKVYLLPPLMLRKDTGNPTDEMMAINYKRGAIDLLPQGRSFAKVRLPKTS